MVVVLRSPAEITMLNFATLKVSGIGATWEEGNLAARVIRILREVKIKS
jgi:hypothetical protein